MNELEKLKHYLLFKDVSEDDNHSEPVVTFGSIVWGVLLRTAIVVVITMILMYEFGHSEMWYFSLFLIWLVALYPAWQQYQNYNKRMEKFEEDTLCGSCKHFSPDSQLCKLYDEHVTTTYIPCEGESWEPKSNF